MFALSVIFDVAPDQIEAFKAAALTQARNSAGKEPDCRSFDVFQSTDTPSRFYFHEVYASRAAFEDVHKKSEHYATYLAATTPMVVDKQVNFWEKL